MQANVTLIVQQPLQTVQRWLLRRTAQTARPDQQLTGHGLPVRTGIKAGNAPHKYHYTLTVDKENK